MKHLFFFIAVTFFVANKAHTQVAAAAASLSQAKPSLKYGWTKGGTLNLTINEAGRNDYWIKAGEQSALGIRGLVDYNFDRKKGKATWLNSIRGRYGVQKATSTGNKFLKNDDFFNYNTTYGQAFSKYWSYAAFASVETQFQNFFMTPGYIKVGPGLLYKPNTHFSILASPAMANLTTKLAKSFKNVKAFGVDSGKVVSFGVGAFALINANYDLAKGVNYKSQTSLYADYLNQPDHVVFDVNNLFTFTVNKYVGATLMLNARYNHDEVQKMQLQHAIGVGISYKL